MRSNRDTEIKKQGLRTLSLSALANSFSVSSMVNILTVVLRVRSFLDLRLTIRIRTTYKREKNDCRETYESCRAPCH